MLHGIWIHRVSFNLHGRRVKRSGGASMVQRNRNNLVRDSGRLHNISVVHVLQNECLIRFDIHSDVDSGRSKIIHLGHRIDSSLREGD